MSAAWWARVGYLVVALSLAVVPTAHAATLRLDGRFGQGGIARVPVRLGVDWALARSLRPVRQLDGKVLVAAAIESADRGPTQFALARFTRTGRPDRRFGRGGRIRLGAQWNFDPRAVQVQPDGRIVLMGAAGRGINSLYPLVAPGQIGLIRLLKDGSRDPTFGTDGFVAWNPPWRPATRWLQAIPGLLLRQADGRLLVAFTVDELRADAPPGAFPNVNYRRIAFVRFNENGAVDEAFGHAGVVEQPEVADSGPNFFSIWTWAALPDGHLVALASRNEGAGPLAPGPIAWWLHRFTADGAPDPGFGQDGSVRLGLNVLDGVNELLPARDGSLVMLGTVHPAHPAGSATAVRRIKPGGQLDARFGTACRRSGPNAPSPGGAATSDGGIFATARGFVSHARIDSFVFRYGPNGCVAGRPLRLRAVSAGPPLLQGRHLAMVGGAIDDHTLALIRIRR
jgi:uncharacterized delta-60 repeat protein